MMQVNEYIESGLLELYVLGNTTPEEAKEVELMANLHPEIAAEITSISASLQQYSRLNALKPDETIKPFLLATIDYGERIAAGEPVSFPPEISETSTLADYSQWLNRDDLAVPQTLPDLYARLIGYTETMTTAIVWIKKIAPQEIHHDQIEKFLVAEGSCDITIGEEVYQLTAGGTLTIPLHLPHFVKVTSAIPCKVILQRIAA